MLERILYLIIAILLFINICHGSPFRSYKITSHQRSDNLSYQLTENVFPEHYILKISPQFNNNTFIGYVQIFIRLKVPTNNITLHQKSLNITKEKIYLSTKRGAVIHIKNAGVSGTEEQEFYTITFQKTLKKNIIYYLYIPEFYGVLNNLNKGFYYAQYIDEHGKLCKFAMTKFEPTYARYAFPCFDEPPFKAKFKVYIVRPSNYHSISNTKLIKSKKLGSGLYEDEFETTVPMSTYLVAYIVSEMKLSPEQNQNFHRILARPDAINKGYEKYALQMGKIYLQTLESYFNVNYSLNKMDQAAIPEKYLTSGAMENWGLVTYGEPYFLFTPRTTTRMHIEIDCYITHEFAHQWFGNLVSIKWWRYLWLKEGFTYFFENYIIDMIKPEWRMMEQFIVADKQSCLNIDSNDETRDMNQDVGTPSEISKLYDSIAYDKAACVIHMLENVMTPAVFQSGVTNFLQDRAFQSATPTDLYRNLQKAMNNSGTNLPEDLSIEKIMTTWDSQKGYPLVYVERNYDKNQHVVKLTQSRYTTYDKDINSKPSVWFIPINYATRSKPNFNDTQYSDWLLKSNAEMTIKILNSEDWIILNKQEAYYYRVNYDVKNWKLISNALLENYTNIHILNRAQIIDDSFNLAKTNILDFAILLEISSYLQQEDDYIVHYPFLRSVEYMAHVLFGADVEKYFQLYITRILQRTYQRLGNNPMANDTQIDKLHRPIVIYWMGKYNYFQCREKARDIFYRWRYHNALLPVDLEKQILCNTLRNENETDWNYVFKIYNSTINDKNFKKNAFKSLGCTENVSILQRFLDSSLSLTSNYDLIHVVTLLCNEGLVGLEVSINYMSVNFESLNTTIGYQNMTNIMTLIASKLTTKKQLEEFSKLMKKDQRVDKFTLSIVKNARLSVSLNQKQAYQISKFFYEARSSGNLSSATPITFAFILYKFSIYLFYIFIIIIL